MDRNDVTKLKFDSRLIGRRGWLSPGELEAELDALPDASAKIADESEPAEPDEAPAPDAPAPPAVSPATPETDFPG